MTNEDFRARIRYCRHGYVIASHSILWDATTYPCLRNLRLTPKSTNISKHANLTAITQGKQSSWKLYKIQYIWTSSSFPHIHMLKLFKSLKLCPRQSVYLSYNCYPLSPSLSDTGEYILFPNIGTQLCCDCYCYGDIRSSSWVYINHLPISIAFFPLAEGQPYGCASTSEITLNFVGKSPGILGMKCTINRHE